MKFSKSLINEIANELNTVLFNSQLAIDLLDIKQKNYDPHIAAWYGAEEIIIFSNFHHTIQQLYETIAHELIHYYQDSLDIPLGHNCKIFRYYSKKYRDYAIWDISAEDFKGNFANMKGI